ncbi:MAG: MmgE/PrpD family protein [Rhodobacteraceae bacterium]|nr:MmgE/PrpD family protein [Paracoccaceae bacterium]
MSALMETILDIAGLPFSSIPEEAYETARLSLYDWLICGIAGRDEPLACKLRQMVADEGGSLTASIFGSSMAPARAAALVNGATSHALDYDDTHFAHIGHLSVGIYPAALAAGEETRASASAVVTAFLLGAEAAIRVGVVLGAGHYNRGFHQTATAGAFGATVAAGRLYGLSRDEMRAALGLCATRTSGLKSQFGTMGKPYNAGVAASNGVECAKLAKLGMTSCEDGLMGDQGFVVTHADEWGREVVSANQFLFGDISFKFHACCHGTHAMIEALLEIMPQLSGKTNQVKMIALRTNPRWLKVCNIPTPQTGLEIKFSYRWLAGMVMEGLNTGAFDTYRDDLATSSVLADFAEKVEVIGDAGITDMQAEGEVIFEDGSKVAFSHDLAQRPTLSNLKQRLQAKGAAVLADNAALVKPVMEEFASLSAADLGLIARKQDDSGNN